MKKKKNAPPTTGQRRGMQAVFENKSVRTWTGKLHLLVRERKNEFNVPVDYWVSLCGHYKARETTVRLFSTYYREEPWRTSKYKCKHCMQIFNKIKRGQR